MGDVELNEVLEAPDPLTRKERDFLLGQLEVEAGWGDVYTDADRALMASIQRKLIAENDHAQA